ncbi:NUDIX hydrolase [Fervidibacillus halotolerans]|uniref:NUDIX hydrolase n=1 Tax=Fervidibacillus halotolerans TaxID=2980027 RepID=A0A9E8M1N6_9BACI|nr:NUDIX hydrolase [Fervidibacillus halotolerans]WAA13825.1 NUDIX hydrolase [Fervidibacillus halotolerans]
MNTFEEKTLKRETIFDGKIITLHVDEVELPNGKTSKREIVKHPGAVAIIMITDEDKLVLVEQYRKPLERSLFEIPAGKMENGESPETTAKRELEEETGYTCEKLNPIASFYTSPGFSDELVHLFKAENILKVENPKTEEDEFLRLHEVTFEQALTLIDEQKIYDAKTVYAIQYWKIQRALRK